MSAPATNARSPAPRRTIARVSGVAVEPVDLGLELLEERCRERVHRRVVDRDERDGAVVLGGDERSQ